MSHYFYLKKYIYRVLHSPNPSQPFTLLCRCGEYVLLSGGPLVARTGLCSQYEVTALHNLEQGPWGLHRRAQGLSLPLQLQVQTFVGNTAPKPTDGIQKVKLRTFSVCVYV